MATSIVPAYYVAIFKGDITKVSRANPGLVVEYWHDALIDGWIVPPLTESARLFIHRRPWPK